MDLVAEANTVREKLLARRKELLAELSRIESALLWRNDAGNANKNGRGRPLYRFGRAGRLRDWIAETTGEFSNADARAAVPELHWRNLSAMLCAELRRGTVVRVRRGVWRKA